MCNTKFAMLIPLLIDNFTLKEQEKQEKFAF